MKGEAPFHASEVLRELSYSPDAKLSFHELVQRLGIPKRDTSRFRHFLRRLVEDQVILPSRDRGYRLKRSGANENAWAVEGPVHRHRAGYGFLTPETGEDLFIPAREMVHIFDGDRIRAVPVPGKFGRLAGRVLEVTSRARTHVVGIYMRGSGTEEVLPDPEIFDQPIELLPGAVEPRPGEIVEVEIRSYPDLDRRAVGRIVEIVGVPGELGTILETVIRRHPLRRRFSEDALEEASALPANVSPDDLVGRTDLRNVPTFTIDGEDARDFDDAVSVEVLPEDGIRLRVSIADVAHYVRKGSPLDVEALERGTSIYFPDRVIPMLPERLSNGIASLVPKEDRLTLTAEMDFDSGGVRRAFKIYESVIRSWGRWTYTDVARVLRGEEVAGISEHEVHVRLLHLLMIRLRSVRDARGSLDFDLPEPDIVLDATGRPEEIVRAERNDAHRLIEEMMIAANEAVADWFVNHRRPTIFRVHSPPDRTKLRAFVDFARAYGHFPDFGALGTARQIGEFLRSIRGLPAERAINHLLLRSMMRAQYSPENIGHFGLASMRYLHFTSPIRRYPDLVVHRLAKAMIHREPSPEDSAQLQRIAEQCSQREAAATKCEYEVLDVIRAAYMQDRVGEEFEGIVSGVIENGVFVELLDVYVEGMIRIEDLRDDEHRYLEEAKMLLGRRTKRRFAIGEPVRVVVQAVHVAMGKVELAPAGQARSQVSPSPGTEDRPRRGSRPAKGRDGRPRFRPPPPGKRGKKKASKSGANAGKKGRGRKR